MDIQKRSEQWTDESVPTAQDFNRIEDNIDILKSLLDEYKQKADLGTTTECLIEDQLVGEDGVLVNTVKEMNNYKYIIFLARDYIPQFFESAMPYPTPSFYCMVEPSFIEVFNNENKQLTIACSNGYVWFFFKSEKLVQAMATKNPCLLTIYGVK